MTRRRAGRGRRPDRLMNGRDPFITAGAVLAWRAEDSVNNGSNTTSLPSYVGSLTLTTVSTGQSPRAASAHFSGRAVVPFNVGSGRGYDGALAVPAAMTVATVARITATSSGLHAMTVSGTVNTGNSCYLDLGNLSSQKLAVHADKAFTFPGNVVTVSVFTAAGMAHYSNGYTAVSQASAGILAGNLFSIGQISSNGIYTLTGEWRTTAYWDRALTNAEVGALLAALGDREGIAIAA